MDVPEEPAVPMMLVILEPPVIASSVPPQATTSQQRPGKIVRWIGLIESSFSVRQSKLQAAQNPGARCGGLAPTPVRGQSIRLSDLSEARVRAAMRFVFPTARKLLRYAVMSNFYR